MSDDPRGRHAAEADEVRQKIAALKQEWARFGEELTGAYNAIVEHNDEITRQIHGVLSEQSHYGRIALDGMRIAGAELLPQFAEIVNNRSREIYDTWDNAEEALRLYRDGF